MDNLIYEIQKEISETNPNYKYTDYYRMCELEYWCHVPNWIKEYNENYKINNCLDIGVAMGTLLLYTHKISDCKLFATEILKHLSDGIISKYNVVFKVLNVELQKIFFIL
jgi:hypothetical protein